MRAFWWFKENSIAGMARPGFNAVHWFDLPFEQGLLLSWLGKFSSESESLESWRAHLAEFAPKVFQYNGLDAVSGARALEVFGDDSGLLGVLHRLRERTRILESFDLQGDRLHFRWSPTRLREEIDFLKSQGIVHIVSLTEQHHHQRQLEAHFTLHHISIQDLHAPNLAQARELTGIIRHASGKGEKLVAHCLAGVSRTSTMLMASHMLMGEDARELEARLKRQNPNYVLTGPQAEFIRSLTATRTDY